MKTTYKVWGAIFGLGMVILVMLHMFLQYGLTKAMRGVVLPRVKQQTGIDVRVDDLSINVSCGLLYLKGVAVRNPEGFGLEDAVLVEKVIVAVDIPSLLRKKPVRVKQVTVQEAVVNVLRNDAGELNVAKLLEGLPQKESSGKSEPVPPSEPQPLPEVLIEALDCNVRARYADAGFDRLDFVLDLSLTGRNVGTVRDEHADWGELALTGSLGDDRTHFLTDLHADLAPVSDPRAMSFDLTGKIMEIDPRIMQQVYDRMGVRSAPFGFDPDLHCREGRFENSSFALNLRKIQLEDKLASRLGGMGSIDALRFPVPVEGTLRKPSVDFPGALNKALGGNAQSLLGAFLEGAAVETAGVDGQAVKKVLKDLAEGGASDTNASSQTASDVMIDMLAEQVEEVGDNEALKKDLKELGRRLFGN